MDVSDHHQRHLQAIKTKEAATAAATPNFEAVRRRRSLLTREVSSNLNNSSMEVAEYHAQELAAVPFVWESSPGTPKRHVLIMKSSCHDIDKNSLPPLTPPPSYQYQSKVIGSTRLSKKKSLKDAGVNNLIQSVLPRLSIKRDHHHHHPPRLSSSSPTKSSSSSSSSSSSLASSSSLSQFVVSTPSPTPRHRLSFDYSSPEVGGQEDEVGSSIGGSPPVSTLCFRRLSSFNRMFRGL